MIVMRVEKTATILATGVLTVTVTMPSRGYIGVPVTLSASWDGIAVGPFVGTIKWGDGASENFPRQSGKSVSRSHTYTASGSFTATVSVSDEYTASGGTGSASATIRVVLSVLLMASPTSGNVPLAVSFTCSAAGGYTPYSWTLDYGDGSTPGSGTRTGEGPWTQSHTYTKLGQFTAKLTVADALGATALSTVVTYAGVEVPPEILQYWWVLAGVGGVLGLIVVGGAVVSQEAERQKLLAYAR